MTDRSDAESRIISSNGAEMSEIIEINVSLFEFASGDDDPRIKSDRLVDADRLVMSPNVPRVN